MAVFIATKCTCFDGKRVKEVVNFWLCPKTMTIKKVKWAQKRLVKNRHSFYTNRVLSTPSLFVDWCFVFGHKKNRATQSTTRLAVNSF